MKYFVLLNDVGKGPRETTFQEIRVLKSIINIGVLTV